MKSLKITGSHGRTETLVWNRCSYQVPEMVRTDAITNKKDKFYNSMVHTIIKGEVLLITKAPLLISFMDLSLQSGSLQFNYTTPEYKPIFKKINLSRVDRNKNNNKASYKDSDSKQRNHGSEDSCWETNLSIDNCNKRK